MSKYKLSEGALQELMSNQPYPDAILQILGCKKINGGTSSTSDRFRILLSDGKHKVSHAMLTTQVVEKLGGTDILPNSIVKLKRSMTSTLPAAGGSGKAGSSFLVVVDIELLSSGTEVGGVIGAPELLVLSSVQQSKQQQQQTNSSTDVPNSSIHSLGSSLQTSSISSTTNSATMNESSLTTLGADKQIISPISSLSPYHNRWVLKARVENKSSIRTWSNSRGDGKLFSFDLIDESGQIRCTVFQELVEKYFELIEIGKVYYISKCQLKTANKRFNSTNNEYEMTVVAASVIEPCHDAEAGEVPLTKYDFTTIDKLALMEVGSIVDVVGVCTGFTTVQTFTSRNTNRELKKREITILDQSKCAINLTLWGEQAVDFIETNNPVVVLKAAKIGEFRGAKSLSTTMNSQYRLNPELSEAHRLKGWYDMVGSEVDAKNISTIVGEGGSGAGGVGGGGNFSAEWQSFRDAEEKQLGWSGKPDYFQVVGTVLMVRSENAIYKSCPSESCNKKVIDMENGVYRCEKCDQDFHNFKYRMIARANIADYSGNHWVTMFNTEAEKMLGKSVQEIGEEIAGDASASERIFQAANFKEFVFKIRAMTENFNDEPRLKMIVAGVDEISNTEFNQHLLNRIKLELNTE